MDATEVNSWPQEANGLKFKLTYPQYKNLVAELLLQEDMSKTNLPFKQFHKIWNIIPVNTKLLP